MTAPEIWPSAHDAGPEVGSLADGIHAVRVGDDLVLLDLPADDYLCLPGCGPLEVTGRDVRGTVEQILRLAAEELVRPTRCANDRPAPPALPTLRLDPTPVLKPTFGDIAIFAGIWLDASRRRPTLQRLQRRYGGRVGRRDDLAAIAARVEVFRQLLPMAPRTGACLLQAELLLRFLNAGGLDADWVFGVRTFPFLAHCWLQIDERCVSEAPETLTVYRPILAI